MNIKSFPERCVIDGVSRVGFYPDVRDKGGKPWPEDFISPSCLRAILEYHGDSNKDYIHLMGVSGAGMFLNWGGWKPDNAALYYMSADLGEMFTRTFDAIGYETRTSSCTKPGENAHEIRDIVLEEINAGRPCLSHGIVGPPETVIITGYDDGGDVLIGWSFFQYNAPGEEKLEFESCGYFRKRNWESSTWDIITVGHQKSQPDPKNVFIEALKWGLQVSLTPRTYQNRANGIAAYDAWIEHLQRDEEIVSWQPEPDSVPPFHAHRDATDTIAEGRWYASQFLVRETSKHMPYQASHLYAAASCFAREHELMWDVWRNEGGMRGNPKVMANFADPEVRRRSIDLIQQARDLDKEAAEHIDTALKLHRINK